MNRLQIPDWLFSLAAILAAMAIALYFRVVVPYPAIFDGHWIKFSGVDSYYYMRLVDNLVANFPVLTGFDPYMVFPGGQAVAVQGTFFAYILSGVVKLLGAAGSQQSMDTIAAYIPAVLGALLVIPVFFVARALAGRWSGLVAALVIAVMPGQFLSRTLLGAVDHHAAELFLTSFFLLFFILALQHSRSFSYGQVRRGEFPPASRHIPYSFIAGIFLGLYLITWQGALMLVLILFAFFILQFTSDHLRGLPTDYLSKTAIICFLIALLIFLPVSRDKMTLLALAAIILMPVALNIASNVMSSYRVKPAYFLGVIAIMLAAGGLAAWLLFPAIYATVTGYLYEFFSWRSGQKVVAEMESLFIPGGFFTLNLAWSEFALALYTGLAGLALLIYHCIRRGEPGHIFIATWSLVWMFISFAMVRFTAYFAVCLAVLTGYAIGYLIQAFAAGKQARTAARPGKKARKAAPPGTRITSRQATAAVIVVVLTAAITIPCMVSSAALAGGNLGTPSNAWMEAMEWMRKNTPEPLGSADDYYKLYTAPETGKGFVYPESAYSVAVWNDYGYWVTRIGHRIPVSNPGTWGLRGEQAYFTAQDNATAARQMAEWGAKYVIVDGRIASPNDKFYALATLAAGQESDFYELCWQKKEGKYVPLLVFYPEFYRTMVSRLYNFDGKQVIPQKTTVMSWQDQSVPDGQRFKEITGFKSFRSCEEADAFLAGQKDGKYRIVGADPLVSPVPLEALDGYKLVYQSEEKAGAGSIPLPVIKIFEYNP
jgi:dolichyl-diphosphooligosaccharide--protein glycosyltransferase